MESDYETFGRWPWAVHCRWVLAYLWGAKDSEWGGGAEPK